MDELTRSAPSVRQIAIAEIECDPVTEDPSSSLADLTASIRCAGVLQPLLVMPNRGRFRLIDGARRLQAATLVGLVYVPCIVQEVDAPQAAREPGQPLPSAVAIDLAESLELAATQAAICARSGFKRRAAGDLLQAELSRAERLARAMAIMLEMPRLRQAEVTARRIVERAALATAAARRLGGVPLEISIDEPDFRVPADAALMTQALAGSIDVMAALGDEVRCGDVDEVADGPEATPDTTLFLSVTCAKIRPAMLIELTQHTVSVEPELLARFFDPTSTLHPGGTSSALLLAAAARIVRSHGGRADARRDGAVGCTLTFVLPQLTPRTFDV